MGEKKKLGKKKKINVVKEVHEVLSELIELPLDIQDCTTIDIVEAAKTRVSTMKRICGTKDQAKAKAKQQ